MLDRKRYRIAFLGLLASMVALSVVLRAIDGARPRRPEPDPPLEIRTYSWCPTPEMRESVAAPEIMTEAGAVVEEVPMAKGGPR